VRIVGKPYTSPQPAGNPNCGEDQADGERAWVALFAVTVVAARTVPPAARASPWNPSRLRRPGLRPWTRKDRKDRLRRPGPPALDPGGSGMAAHRSRRRPRHAPKATRPPLPGQGRSDVGRSTLTGEGRPGRGGPA